MKWITQCVCTKEHRSLGAPLQVAPVVCVTSAFPVQNRAEQRVVCWFVTLGKGHGMDDNFKYGHLNWSSATRCITVVQAVETKSMLL
jgi:hypothetical protein